MDTFFPSACMKKILTSSNTTPFFLQLRMRILYRYKKMLYHIVSWLIISRYIDISIYRGSTKVHVVTIDVYNSNHCVFIVCSLIHKPRKPVTRSKKLLHHHLISTIIVRVLFLHMLNQFIDQVLKNSEFAQQLLVFALRIYYIHLEQIIKYCYCQCIINCAIWPRKH